MSWPPTKEDLEKLRERMLAPPEPPMRFVSPREYDVLQKMATEGKLDMSGYPKAEHFDEYCKLMNPPNPKGAQGE